MRTVRQQLGCVKRIWYLATMRAAKVQASLPIRAVLPEPPLLAHTSSESRGTFRQKARSLTPLNGWACAVKICHDGMLENTNSLDGAQLNISCCLSRGSDQVCFLEPVLVWFCHVNIHTPPLTEPRQANLCLQAFRHDTF